MGFDKVAASGQESVSRLALDTARWRPLEARAADVLSGAAVCRNDHCRSAAHTAASGSRLHSSQIGMPSRPVRHRT